MLLENAQRTAQFYYVFKLCTLYAPKVYSHSIPQPVYSRPLYHPKISPLSPVYNPSLKISQPDRNVEQK